ncbi:hypothetical protein C8J57DRAFT_1221992 [Mycena rebaudengoi]|nr:hypothetical protein C8J57DRAFT_1221992 [Mycena rebaudengoi]
MSLSGTQRRQKRRVRHKTGQYTPLQGASRQVRAHPRSGLRSFQRCPPHDEVEAKDARVARRPPTEKNVTERWWKEQGGEGGSGTSGEGGRGRGRGRRGPDGQPRRGRKGVDEIGEGRGGEEGRDEARAPRKSADGEGRGWDGMGGREWIKAGREGSEWGGAGRDEWRGGIKPGAGDAVDGVGEWGGRGEERRGSGPNDACCEAEADDAPDGGAEKVGREKDGGWSGWIKEIGDGSNGGDPRSLTPEYYPEQEKSVLRSGELSPSAQIDITVSGESGNCDKSVTKAGRKRPKQVALRHHSVSGSQDVKGLKARGSAGVERLGLGKLPVAHVLWLTSPKDSGFCCSPVKSPVSTNARFARNISEFNLEKIPHTAPQIVHFAWSRSTPNKLGLRPVNWLL